MKIGFKFVKGKTKQETEGKGILDKPSVEGRMDIILSFLPIEGEIPGSMSGQYITFQKLLNLVFLG